MWAFSAAPPNQLIYGADHRLLCCRAFLFFWGGGDRHQSSLSDKIEYFWCALCVCVCVPVVLQCGIKVCSGVRTMCVRVLGCWCCCWDYEGCSALVGMRGELLGHILGTPRRWEHQSVTRAGLRGRKRCRCSSNDLQLIAPHADTHTHTHTDSRACMHARKHARIYLSTSYFASDHFHPAGAHRLQRPR